MHPNFPFEINPAEIAVFSENHFEFQQLQDIVKFIKWHQLVKLFDELQELISGIKLPADEQSWGKWAVLLTGTLDWGTLDSAKIDAINGLGNVCPDNTYPDEQLKELLEQSGCDLQIYPMLYRLRHHYFFGPHASLDNSVANKLHYINKETALSFYITCFDYLPHKYLAVAKKVFEKTSAKSRSHKYVTANLLRLTQREIMTFIIAYKNNLLETKQLPKILAQSFKYDMTQHESWVCQTYCAAHYLAASQLTEQGIASLLSDKKDSTLRNIFLQLICLKRYEWADKVFDAITLNQEKKEWVLSLFERISHLLEPIIHDTLFRKVIQTCCSVSQLAIDFEQLTKVAIEQKRNYFLGIILEEYSPLTDITTKPLIDAINYGLSINRFNCLPLLLAKLIQGVNNDEKYTSRIKPLITVTFSKTDEAAFQTQTHLFVYQFIRFQSIRTLKTVKELTFILQTILEEEHVVIDLQLPYTNANIALAAQISQQSTTQTVEQSIQNAFQFKKQIIHFHKLLSYKINTAFHVFLFCKKTFPATLFNYLKGLTQKYSIDLQRAEENFDQFLISDTTAGQFAERLYCLKEHSNLIIDYQKMLTTLKESGETMHCIILCQELVSEDLMTIQEAENAIAEALAIEKTQKAEVNRNDKVFENTMGFTIAEQSKITMRLLEFSIQLSGALLPHEQTIIDWIDQDHIAIRFSHATNKLQDIRKNEVLVPTEDLIAENRIRRSTTPPFLQGNVFLSIGAGKANITNFLRGNYDIVQINLSAAIRDHLIRPQEIWTSMHYWALQTNRTYHPFIFLSPCKQFGTIYRAKHIRSESKQFTGQKEHHFYHVQISPNYKLLDKEIVTITHEMDIIQGDPREFIAKKLIWFLRRLQSPLLPQHYGHYLQMLFSEHSNTYKVEVENIINCLFSPGNFETKVSQRIAFSNNLMLHDNNYFLKFIENPNAVAGCAKPNLKHLQQVLEHGSKQAFVNAYQNELVNGYNNHELVTFALEVLSATRVSWLLELGVDMHNHSLDYLTTATARCLFDYYFRREDLEEARSILYALLLQGTRPADQQSQHIAALVNTADSPVSFWILCQTALLMNDNELFQIINETGTLNGRGVILFFDSTYTDVEETDSDYLLLLQINSFNSEELIDFIAKLPELLQEYDVSKNSHRVNKIFAKLIQVIYFNNNLVALEKLLLCKKVNSDAMAKDFRLKAFADKNASVTALLAKIHKINNNEPYKPGHFEFLWMYQQGLLHHREIQNGFKEGHFEFDCLITIYLLIDSDPQLAKFYASLVEKPTFEFMNVIKNHRFMSATSATSHLKSIAQLTLIEPFRQDLVNFSVDLWHLHASTIHLQKVFNQVNPEFFKLFVNHAISLSLTADHLLALTSACIEQPWSESFYHDYLDQESAAELLVNIAECCSEELFALIYAQLPTVTLRVIFQTAYKINLYHSPEPMTPSSVIHYLLNYYLKNKNSVNVGRLFLYLNTNPPSVALSDWINKYQTHDWTPWADSETLIHAIADARHGNQTLPDLFQDQWPLPVVGRMLDHLAETTDCAWLTNQLLGQTEYYYFSHVKSKQLIKLVTFFHQKKSLLHLASIEPNKNPYEQKFPFSRVLSTFKGLRLSSHLVTTSVGEQDCTWIILGRSHSNFIVVRNSLHPYYHANNFKSDKDNQKIYVHGKTTIKLLTGSSANSYEDPFNNFQNKSWVFKNYPAVQALPEIRVALEKQAKKSKLNSDPVLYAELTQLATLLNQETTDALKQQIAQLNLPGLKFQSVRTPEIHQLFKAIFTKNLAEFQSLYTRLEVSYTMPLLSQEMVIDFPYALETLTRQIERYNKLHGANDALADKFYWLLLDILETLLHKKTISLVNCAVLANNESVLAFLMTKEAHQLQNGVDRHLNPLLLALAFNRIHLAKLLLAGLNKSYSLVIGYLKSILLKFIEPDMYSGFRVLKTEKCVKLLCELFLSIWDIKKEIELLAVAEEIKKLNITLQTGTKGAVLQALKELQKKCFSFFEFPVTDGVEFHVYLWKVFKPGYYTPFVASSFEVTPTLREAAESRPVHEDTGVTKEKPLLALSKTAIDWDSVKESQHTASVCYEEDQIAQLEQSRKRDGDTAEVSVRGASRINDDDEANARTNSRRRRTGEFFQSAATQASSALTPQSAPLFQSYHGTT